MVRMRSAVRIRPAASKSIENFGFRCFFVAQAHFQVWVKMWGNRLTHTVTHTVTHTRKCAERVGWEHAELNHTELTLMPHFATR